MEMENWTRIFVAEVCSNPEITALLPEPGDPRPKPGDFGSNPESWQPYALICLRALLRDMHLLACRLY